MTSLTLSPDELLATTRALRKRLDLSRPVEPALIEVPLACAVCAQRLELAEPALPGGDRPG